MTKTRKKELMCEFYLLGWQDAAYNLFENEWPHTVAEFVSQYKKGYKSGLRARESAKIEASE